VNQRPEGYNPLGVKNLDPEWARRLGQTGKDCYAAILRRDLRALADSMNACMECWEAILPHTVRHPKITIDLKGILANFQSRYPGAMYSGCGGGYLMVIAARTFQARSGCESGPDRGDQAMLKTGILNPAINSLLSRVRHTNTLAIADRAFPSGRRSKPWISRWWTICRGCSTCSRQSARTSWWDAPLWRRSSGRATMRPRGAASNRR